MSPDKFKTDVQAAYMQAVRNTNSWVSYTDQTHRMFEGISVFGEEAGVDLAHTFIEAIQQEAVRAARAKRSEIQLRPGKMGKAALHGFAKTLREVTGLPVTEAAGVVTVAWAKDEPALY